MNNEIIGFKLINSKLNKIEDMIINKKSKTFMLVGINGYEEVTLNN